MYADLSWTRTITRMVVVKDALRLDVRVRAHRGASRLSVTRQESIISSLISWS